MCATNRGGRVLPYVGFLGMLAVVETNTHYNVGSWEGREELVSVNWLVRSGYVVACLPWRLWLVSQSS
jgi:hypothetical protein